MTVVTMRNSQWSMSRQCSGIRLAARLVLKSWRIGLRAVEPGLDPAVTAEAAENVLAIA